MQRPQNQERVWCFGPGLLNLLTADILGWRVLCAVRCRTLSNILAVPPLDASGAPPPVVDNRKRFRTLPDVLRGAKLH